MKTMNYLTNRFFLAVHVQCENAQMKSKSVRTKKYATSRRRVE